MKTRSLEVKLLTYPHNALGTLFYVWEQSRTNDPIPHPEIIEQILSYPHTDYSVGSDGGGLLKYLTMLGVKPIGTSLTKTSDGEIVPNWWDITEVKNRINRIIDQILDEDIPCTENLSFVFGIENMSISLREQMVRHRIGVTIGERTGIDIVPEIGKSSWWSQTMRMLPMGKFYSERRYILPDGLKGKFVTLDNIHLGFDKECSEYNGSIPADELYTQLFSQIELVYNKLIEAGVAMEDARQIIPIGATHGITWQLNLKSMMHIVGKRACWVAQANLWEQLISGMVNELCDKVSPVFRKIILPPCFKKGTYNTCPYFQINKERVQGRDHMPPCPLYVYHENRIAVQASVTSLFETGQEATWTPPDTTEGVREMGTGHSLQSLDIRNWNTTQEVERRMLYENIERFERLWKLDILTGESK